MQREFWRFHYLLATVFIATSATYFSAKHLANPTYISSGLAAGAVCILTSIILVLFAFFRQKRSQPLRERIPETLGYLITSFSYMTMYFFVLALADRTIPQMPTSPEGISIVIGVVSGFLIYNISLAFERHSANQLVVHATIGTVCGMLLSILLSDSSDWWQRHFSSLGSNNTASAWLFDMTLYMVSLFNTLIGYLVANDIRRIHITLGRPYKARVFITRLLLSLVGAMAFIAATISYTENFVVHDTAARFMGVFMALFVLVAPWLVPRLPKSFVIFSIILSICPVLAWPYVLSLELKLSLYEIITILGVLMWLALFTRIVDVIKRDTTEHKKSSA